MQFLEYLETHVINICNLNCKGCSHFSNIVDEDDAIVDIINFEKDFIRLRELFDHIFMIRLMGGEPFINKELGDYIIIVRKYFPESDLRILTNGLLIPSASENLLDIIAANEVVIDISSYPVTESIRPQIEERLEKFGIKCNFSELVTKFHKRLNIEGTHNPVEMFKSCPSKICTFVHDGKLAVCPAPFMSVFLNKRFGTNIEVECDLLDLYQDGITAEYVKDYLRKPMKSCGYCSLPEDYMWECGLVPKLEDWLVAGSLGKDT